MKRTKKEMVLLNATYEREYDAMLRSDIHILYTNICGKEYGVAKRQTNYDKTSFKQVINLLKEELINKLKDLNSIEFKTRKRNWFQRLCLRLAK